jgi:hypothetical protein
LWIYSKKTERRAIKVPEHWNKVPQSAINAKEIWIIFLLYLGEWDK